MVIWTSDGKGNVYICYSALYEINIINGKGELVKKIKKEHTPEKITREEEKKLKEEYFSHVPKEFIKQIHFPKVKPPVINIFSMEDYIFILRKTDRESHKYIYDVLLNGIIFNSLELDFLPHFSRDGFIYTIQHELSPLTNEILKTHIKRFKIKDIYHINESY